MKKILLGEKVIEEKIEANQETTFEEEAIAKEKYSVSFAKLKDDMVSLKKDISEIKLKYISSKNINIVPQINNDNKIAIYKDVEDGVDLKYELEEKRLKESFVINQRKGNYAFNFEAKIGDLEPSYNETRKCLELKRNGVVVCRMLPPFMFDNKGTESKKCSYEIENNENGLLTIKLIADAEWINSDERELPIIIDPTFEFDVRECNRFSTYENGRLIDSDYDPDELFIGYKNENDEFKFYSFHLYLDVPSLPIGENNSDKNIYLEIPVNYNIMDESDNVVVIIEGTPIGSYKPSYLFNNGVMRLNLSNNLSNLSSDVRIEFKIASDNSVSGDYHQNKTFKQGVYKASLQAKDSSGAARVKIVVEPKQESKSYVDYDIGISGITSINVQTKRYKHRVNDLSIRSGLLALDIDHIFDSRSNANSVFGQGWTLSICQRLEKETFDYNGKAVTYVDENGDKHCFLEKWFYKSGSTKYYVERDQVTLSENNELVTRYGEPVEYELVNDEGYQYISLSSVSNYDAKAPQYRYYIKYNGFKKPVIRGKSNYLQFVYYSNDALHYVDSSKVELKSNGFYAKVDGEEKRVFLSNSSTSVNFTTGKATMYVGDNKNNPKQVTLEKVPVYENLDADLYASGELENLEYEMNQANYNLKEINRIIAEKRSKEVSLLNSMANTSFYKNEQSSSESERKKNDQIHLDFIQIENELITANERLDSIERNAYFITRNFNAKLKEQKESVNDYIINPDGTILLFDGYGRMIGIMDKDEDKIEIIYNKDGNIESVASDEEQVVFKYSNQKLELIKKSNGDTVKFNYFMDGLSEIDNNGRKTTITYLNGLQVYSDINDEIIVDTQTTNTLKVKKYVEPGTITETKEFQPFVDRTLVQNDKYEYSNSFITTRITNRIKNEVTTIDFDFCGEIKKQEDSKHITYANYYKDKPISLVKMKKSPIVVANKTEFGTSVNKYSLSKSAKQKYPSKTNVYCLKVDLYDLPTDQEDAKAITMSVSYVKGGETYNFKQIFIGKENETIVLPFFLKGEVSNFTAEVQTGTQSLTELNSYVKDVSIIAVEDGSLYEYDEKNRLWKIKNIEGKTTYLTFEDKLPTHIEFKDWDGKAVTTDCAYDDEGKLVSSIDSKGNVKNYLYQDGGKTIETKEYNLKDASLVRSSVSSYDDKAKIRLEKGPIKNKKGELPVSKTAFYPGTDIVKTAIELDGSKTEYNINPLTKQLVGLIKENGGVKNSVAYVYNRDFLTAVKENGAEISYTYDGRKRIKTVKIKGYNYNTISNVYTDNITVTDKQNNSYSYGSIVKTTLNGVYTVTSKYTKDGNLLSVIQGDTANGYSSYITYNDDNLVTAIETIKTGDDSYSESVYYSYDENDNLTSTSKIFEENNTRVEDLQKIIQYKENGTLSKLDVSVNNDIVQSTVFSYNTDNLLSREVINDKHQINYEYDALNRISHHEVRIDENASLCHAFSYLQQDGNTLDLIAEDNVIIKSSNNGYLTESHKYNYDVNGRVAEIIIDDKKITYEYDAVGRLVSECNELLEVMNIYVYDQLGNILSKTTYDLKNGSLKNRDEMVYSCDSKHLLVAINDEQVTYDAYGRMTSYKGNTFVWNREGTLKSCTSENELASEYAYNDKGIRYKKVLNNGETVRFVLDGDRILKEDHNSYSINYLYSVNKLIGFIYNEEVFIYERNIFGDIVRIYNSAAEIVGEYQYDAFGNVTIVTDVGNIATINPFRYRGYYYDSETGLYYLNARYYNPSIGRFISPDDVSYINPDNINGLNTYAYCNNDPVNLVDSSGHDWNWATFWKGVLLIGTAIGAVVASVATFGIATPLAMTIVAGVTLAAGILTGVNGIATIIEAGTDYNFVRDGIFNGLGWSDEAYDVYAGVTEIVAIVGSIVCSVWNATSKIKGFTHHGRESALTHDGHGVSARAMQNATRHPLKVVYQSNGGIKHFGKNAVVVLNKSGEVITTYPLNHLGWRSSLWSILKHLLMK